MGVPLFYEGGDPGPGGWPSPPTEPVDVDFFSGGERVATAGGFVVQDLPQAPGTATSTQETLQAVAADLEALGAWWAPEVDLSAQYTSAALGTLHELVAGTSEHALPQLLADLSDDDRALLDALLASSGSLEGLSAFEAGLADLLAQLDSLAWATPLVTLPTTDGLLALQLQLYVIVQGFADDVISQLTLNFSTVAGVVGVVRSVPQVTVVAATLTVIDFMLKKVALSAVPAELVGIDLTLAHDTVAFGELTDADVTLHAVNHPAPVTLHDVLNLVLTGLGLYGTSSTPPAWVSGFETALTAVLDFVTSELQRRIAAYASAHPDASFQLDVTLGATVPPLAWEAAATRRDLLSLQSAAPSILAPDPDVIAWRASDTTAGQAGIWVMPATGPDVVLWPLPPGFTYAGGAFGETMPASPTVDVTVMAALGLEVSFPSVLTPGASGTLHVRAGDEEPSGAILGLPGLQVDVVVSGGSPGLAVGQTNAEGRFEATLTPDVGVDQMTIGVTVRDPQHDRERSETLIVTIDPPVFALIATGSADGVDLHSAYGYLAWAYGGSDAFIEGAPAGGVPYRAASCSLSGGLDLTDGGMFAASTPLSSMVVSVVATDDAYTLFFHASIDGVPLTNAYANAVSPLVFVVDNPANADVQLSLSWAFDGTLSVQGTSGPEDGGAYWHADLSWARAECGHQEVEYGNPYDLIQTITGAGLVDNAPNPSGTSTIRLPPGRHFIAIDAIVSCAGSGPEFGTSSCTLEGTWTLSR